MTDPQLALDLAPPAAPRRGRAKHEAVTRASGIARVTLTIDEAASALGISRDHLERHVLGDLRVIYSGRRRLIPITELHRWVERQAVASPALSRRA